jgi:fatty-acid desaturase
MMQGGPIIVNVVQQPVESTTVADVLLGAMGLTGVLVLAAVLLGAVFGAILIGVKLLRARAHTSFEAGAESGTIHIV